MALLGLPSGFGAVLGGEPADARRTSTAGHAGMLRGLSAWAAALPEGVRDVEVRDTGATYTTTLWVPDPEVRAALLAEHAVLTDPAVDASWSPWRGTGLTPTGHDLTITTG